MQHIHSTSEILLKKGIDANRSFSKNINNKSYKAFVFITEVNHKNGKSFYRIKFIDGDQKEISKKYLFEGREINVYKSDSLKITLKPEQKSEMNF